MDTYWYGIVKNIKIWCANVLSLTFEPKNKIDGNTAQYSEHRDL